MRRHRRRAAPTRFNRAEPELIAAVNLGPLGGRLALDARKCGFELLGDRLRALLVRALDQLLLREAPAREIVPDGAHRQRENTLPVDPFADGAPPQRKRQPQLIGRRVGERALARMFLLRGQSSMCSDSRAALLGRERVQPSCLKPVPPHLHGQVVNADLGEQAPGLTYCHRNAPLLCLSGQLQGTRIWARHGAPKRHHARLSTNVGSRNRNHRKSTENTAISHAHE